MYIIELQFEMLDSVESKGYIQEQADLLTRKNSLSSLGRYVQYVYGTKYLLCTNDLLLY